MFGFWDAAQQSPWNQMAPGYQSVEQFSAAAPQLAQDPAAQAAAYLPGNQAGQIPGFNPMMPGGGMYAPTPLPLPPMPAPSRGFGFAPQVTTDWRRMVDPEGQTYMQATPNYSMMNRPPASFVRGTRAVI